MNTRIALQSLILGVSTLALSACNRQPEQAPARLMLVTQAETADSVAQVFAGEVRARQEMQLAFRVPGKIAMRYVDSGARVQAGQVLARLDNSDYALQDQAAYASVQALKADRDLASAELSRYKDLVAKQLVSKSLFETKQAQAQAAQSRYSQALAQSKLNTNQSSYTQLLAPSDGVISQRMQEAGQVVAAGQPVFNFAANGARDVAITVAEQHIPNLKLHQAVWVEIWTQAGKRYPARIREIAAMADPITRTYAVRVALEDGGADIQLGQSARVLMQEAQRTTLAVPLSAITEINNQSAVWVVDAKTNMLHKRAVNVLRYGAQHAELSSGLAQNEWIVLAGVHLLREGELVRAVDKNNRPIHTESKNP